MIQQTIEEECAMWQKRYNEQTAIAVSCHVEKSILQGEIETVTQWLDMLEIPDKEEAGMEIGWMRRVAIALGIQPHKLSQNASVPPWVKHEPSLEVGRATTSMNQHVNLLDAMG
jgi:hypothetical protein